MNTIDELIEVFRKFPGVGPRQAERFVYYLLRQRKDYLRKISSLIPELSEQVHICDLCRRFYTCKNKNSESCNICSDKNRDQNTLMIIARDVDLQSIEKSGTFDGVYFVLGGLVPILDKDPSSRIRIKDLLKILKKRNTDRLATSGIGLTEIIIALSANPEGENTTEILKKELSEFATTNKIKITVLGRGLSTGTELEYSDSETIKNALRNRF